MSIWFHAGRAAERQTIQAQVERFNAAQSSVHVTLTLIPEGSYNGQVQAAALAGDLPDLLEFDGPFVYNYAWQGKLRPLDDLLAERLQSDLLPSVLRQGTYRGAIYSLATFDSGLALYGRRSQLEAVGARIPQAPVHAWTVTEFEAVLAALAATDPDGAVLDLKLNYAGEWFTYGFSPVIQSAGGDLIDRAPGGKAGGVLNGPEAVRALTHVQGWLQGGYVDPNLDDGAFVQGRVALSWVGHWEYGRYHQAVGDDLVLVPLPDFGQGTRTGQGSWNWGITVNCRNPRAAMDFLQFLLRPEEVLAMTQVNGAVPATRSAIARSARYRPGGPLALYTAQLTGGYAIPRPRTPAYPVITTSFERAFRDIRNGVHVQQALDRAARTIDEDLADNHGYPAAHPG